uniref:Uncharacterized protein n=1 Tax=Kwoniella pini CBS 10737 TaxID=1296096 RepID=A0A1B9I245_9TREE|nr:uncharacterized protein I206_04131 [Kwoniella pini CBS 10737]OCF49609.1 hypothetical protein I206_04131 [Kwoniella pini CBS 10737]
MTFSISLTQTAKRPQSPSFSCESNKKSMHILSVTVPPDVISRIAFFADNPTRAKLLRTSTSNYLLVSRILYERITISKENAAKLFLGLPRSVPQPFQKDTETDVGESLHLQWPDISIEIDDEAAICKDDTGEAISPIYIVSQVTFHRKIALLKLVKHITISSLPDHHICKDLEAWPRSHHVGRTLFPNAASTCYQALAVWQFLDWSDRHIDFDSHHTHPLAKILSSFGKTHHTCITWPDSDQSMEAAYINTRQRAGTKLSIDQLKERFAGLINRCDYSIMRHLVPFRVEALNIHQFRSGHIPVKHKKVRVFFSDCDCRAPTTAKRCVGHIDHATRVKSLCGLASSVASSRDWNTRISLKQSISEIWELVSPPKRYSSDAGSEGQWFELKQEVIKKHPDWENEGSIMVEYDFAAPSIAT